MIKWCAMITVHENEKGDIDFRFSSPPGDGELPRVLRKVADAVEKKNVEELVGYKWEEEG